MARISYVNGRYVPHGEAAVHVEDRGYQFADGIYEVCGVVGGRLKDAEPHLDRLERSLGELSIAMPMSRRAMMHVIGEMIRRNKLDYGMVYIQVTRGVAKRDHAFPKTAVAPALVMTAYATSSAGADARAAKGVAVKTMPDIRWGRCDIKTIGLTANVLAKQAAREAGCYEAWLVDSDGYVTEGASTSAWIIDAAGRLRTRHLDTAILPGITRQVLIEGARARDYVIQEERFTVAEAQGAREAFITAATAFVMPVVEIDGVPVGEGRPGKTALALRELYKTLGL